jgi:hypothetical protein
MAMATILGVHGAFHEMWGPTQILRRWQPALQDGVLIAGGELPADSVSVAFYGDLFRHDPSDGALDDDALRALAQASGLAEVAQHMLGPDAASVLAKVLGEDMLRRTIDQVGHYFGDDEVRSEVRARVVGAVQPDTRVVVAHSLGSIVAYDCLRAHPEWPVETFVTIGSPLGNRELVLSRLETDPAWPVGLRRWVNVTAPSDQVCAGSQLGGIYDARVEDVVVDNGHRGHDPEPYLCARATGQVLRDALGC